MTLKLLEVKPATIDSKSGPKLEAAFDVSNDYGTPNLLFLYYVSLLPDDLKKDLDNIQDDFHSWNAWELGQAERQLIGHVEGDRLPSDDSIASRIIRNNYRAKALRYFRDGNEAWLSASNGFENNKTIETTLDAANGDILRLLRSLAKESQSQKQFEVIINVISGGIDTKEENQFFFSHVDYKYDSNSKSFSPDVRDTTLTLTPQEGSSEETLKIDVHLAVSTYSFDRILWGRVRHEGEEDIERGEPIRQQMAFNFYVNN